MEHACINCDNGSGTTTSVTGVGGTVGGNSSAEVDVRLRLSQDELNQTRKDALNKQAKCFEETLWRMDYNMKIKKKQCIDDFKRVYGNTGKIPDLTDCEGMADLYYPSDAPNISLRNLEARLCGARSNQLSKCSISNQGDDRYVIEFTINMKN